MIHGGDITTYKEEFGSAPIDFSANISPLGLPQEIKDELTHALDDIIHYPDPLCRELTQAIATKDNINYDNIICGNGASEIIYQLIYTIKPMNALVLAPTFAEYEEALKTLKCDIEYYLLEEKNSFQIKKNILNKISSYLDIVFICQPNNPTGVLCEPEILEKMIAKCQKTGTYIVIDECFIDFLEEDEKYSMMRLIENNPYLIIIKAFTKMYALAGLRLGYGVTSNLDLLQLMKSRTQPWAVSSLAQRAGVIATGLDEYVNKVKAIVKEERTYLTKNLMLLGFHVYPTYANYILFKSEIQDDKLDIKLREKGIMIRNCSNYIGLDEWFYRVAIKSHEENEKLIEILKIIGSE